ncbi:hypothetical protein [Nocardia sp. NPDC003963]
MRKAEKPLTRRGKLFTWGLIGVIVLFSVGIGVGLLDMGLDARTALADGPSGTFTPTDRRCGKDGCTFTGDFVGHDGTITRIGIPLRDNARVRHGDAVPAEIDDVHLHDDADGPVGFTTDYNWRWNLFGGTALPVFGLAISVFLILMMKRRGSRTRP